MKMNWYAFPSQFCFYAMAILSGVCYGGHTCRLYRASSITGPSLPRLALGGHGKRGRVRVLPRVGVDKTCRLFACWVCVCVFCIGDTPIDAALPRGVWCGAA